MLRTVMLLLVAWQLVHMLESRHIHNEDEKEDCPFKNLNRSKREMFTSSCNENDCCMLCKQTKSVISCICGGCRDADEGSTEAVKKRWNTAIRILCGGEGNNTKKPRTK
ncbi:uncharacterized protein LOC141907583 [Tubulanus polymorphus]|uniref:uncharacterized protein LOC141907583 n=1 Tax=Tubulanus polymorphus TaxID=672921 RepID=UPI003DA43B9E